MFFWKSFAFTVIQWMLEIWSLVLLPFADQTWISTSSWFTYCWSLTRRIWALLCQHVKWVQLCSSLSIFWHCLSLIGMKTDLFQFCDHCWVFQICCHTECSTLTASSLRIWNSLAGIVSPPVALFVVMLPKAQLTSHSRISASRWVLMPS